ncbi:MAG: glycosyltransferase [Propioniciclava sp.]|uniref:glycosyltransferase n=1 Tax=Propioniciclava sp. TaxID=2038686 RepID=UPI0039E22D7B
MTLRLLFVSMHTSPASAPGAGDAGGMNVVEMHQALALARLGYSVDIVTRRSAPDQPDVMELDGGVRLLHLNAGPQTDLAKSAIDAHIEEFSAGLARLEPYNLIQSHHWMSGVAALPIARAWKVPHVQSFHSVAAHPGRPLADGEPPESDARVAGEALIARESDAIIAVSTAEARTVVERCGADPDRVIVIPPGVDLDTFRPAQRTDTPPVCPWCGSRAGYVLMAARLQPLKGGDLAIRALAQLPSLLRPDLVIAGDVSHDFADYRDEVERLIDDLGMRDHVHFVGAQSRPDLARLMRHSIALMVPSHSETFGLVALEGAASGVPVLASSTGGLREVVVHEETGYLMHDRDPVSWGRTLGRILNDNTLRARLGVIARVHARRFRWHDIAVRLAETYEQLAGR